MSKVIRLKGKLTRKQRIKYGITEPGFEFHTYFKISDKKAEAFSDEISRLLPEEIRVRSPGVASKKKLVRLRSAILANTLYANLLDKPCHYSRQNDMWSKKTNKRIPKWMQSGGPKNEIDRWVDAGLLVNNIGFRSSAATEQSEMFATDLLVQVAKNLEISLGEIEEADEERPKMKINIKVKQREKIRFDFDESVEPYKSIISEMNKYNGLVSQHNIKVIRNEVPLVLPCNSLYPVFHNEELTLGGRYYGATYQRIPSELRSFILMNGEPTVELDYKA